MTVREQTPNCRLREPTQVHANTTSSHLHNWRDDLQRVSVATLYVGHHCVVERQRHADHSGQAIGAVRARDVNGNCNNKQLNGWEKIEGKEDCNIKNK